MDFRYAQPPQRGPMGLSAVPLVFSQLIAWVTLVQIKHQRIAFGFGQDRGAGNAQATGIAFDKRGL